MNEFEKRRQSLLRETRKRYSESYKTPAVHPRYRGAYQAIYDSEDKTPRKNYIWIKLIFCVLIVLSFLLIHKMNWEIANLNSDKIVQLIRETLFG
jgi:hypothetical protein